MWARVTWQQSWKETHFYHNHNHRHRHHHSCFETKLEKEKKKLLPHHISFPLSNTTIQYDILSAYLMGCLTPKTTNQYPSYPSHVTCTASKSVIHWKKLLLVKKKRKRETCFFSIFNHPFFFLVQSQSPPSLALSNVFLQTHPLLFVDKPSTKCQKMKVRLCRNSSGFRTANFACGLQFCPYIHTYIYIYISCKDSR